MATPLTRVIPMASTGASSSSSESEIGEHTRRAIQEVCKSIGETFNAHETSIYLVDPLSQAGEYELQATTWPFQSPPLPTSYRVGGIGITPWVLENARPVRFFNLGAYNAGALVDDTAYPLDGLLPGRAAFARPATADA
jgi:hypothetical protein